METHVLVLLIILVVLLAALLVCHLIGSAAKGQGLKGVIGGFVGGGPAASGLAQSPILVDYDRTGEGTEHHSLTKSLLGYHLERAGEDHARQMQGEPSRAIQAIARPNGPVTGGEREKAVHGGKHWTKFDTWEELTKNGEAVDQYQKEKNEVMKNFKFDWSQVREQAAPLLKDNREWGGLINIVNGKPKIVLKVQSPLKIGEGVAGDTGAVIPAEVMRKITERPAMFVFHTHPEGLSNMLSPTDLSLGVLGLYDGRYGAHVMISPDLVTVYAPKPELIDHIWDDPHPPMAAVRTAFDLYNSAMALRSWATDYTFRDLERICDSLGFGYYLFPTDNFMNLYYFFMYSSAGRVNISELEQFTRILGQEQSRAYPGEASKGRPRTDEAAVTKHRKEEQEPVSKIKEAPVSI